jgi:hypothetical protein
LIDRGPIPQDMAASLLERMDPEFFKKLREASQSEAGFPDDISSLLDGTSPSPNSQERATGNEGGEITPGGSLPPTPTPAL